MLILPCLSNTSSTHHYSTDHPLHRHLALAALAHARRPPQPLHTHPMLSINAPQAHPDTDPFADADADLFANPFASSSTSPGPTSPSSPPPATFTSALRYSDTQAVTRPIYRRRQSEGSAVAAARTPDTLAQRGGDSAHTRARTLDLRTPSPTPSHARTHAKSQSQSQGQGERHPLGAASGSGAAHRRAASGSGGTRPRLHRMLKSEVDVNASTSSKRATTPPRKASREREEEKVVLVHQVRPPVP